MTHNEVFKWFELYFPIYAGDKIDTWFQNGKNSIRVRQTNGRNLYLLSMVIKIGNLKQLIAL